MSEQQTNGSTLFRDFQLSLRASKPWFEGVNEIQQSITFGILEEFNSDVISASPAYTYDTGSGLYVSSGALFATTSGVKQIYRNNLGYEPIDVRATIKHSTSATTSGYYFGQLLRRLSATVAIDTRLDLSGPNLAIYKLDSSYSLLASTAVSALSASTSYWFRSQALGNNITTELWTVDPFGSVASPSTQLTYALSGSDSTLLGDGVQGDVGLEFSNPPYNAPFDEHRIEPRTLDHQVITIDQTGDFNSRPRIRLYGPFADTTVTNETYLEDETTYRSITINDAISASTYYEYDVQEGTLRDVAGNNKFSQLDIESKDILLPPGTSYISIATASTFGTPQLDVFYRNTWM